MDSHNSIIEELKARCGRVPHRYSWNFALRPPVLRPEPEKSRSQYIDIYVGIDEVALTSALTDLLSPVGLSLSGIPAEVLERFNATAILVSLDGEIRFLLREEEANEGYDEEYSQWLSEKARYEADYASYVTALEAYADQCKKEEKEEEESKERATYLRLKSKYEPHLL